MLRYSINIREDLSWCMETISDSSYKLCFDNGIVCYKGVLCMSIIKHRGWSQEPIQHEVSRVLYGASS